MSHRRRGVGIGRSAATAKYAQKKADEIKAFSLQSAIDTMERLEVKLTEFATQHAAEMQSDPVFRQRFLQMCAPLGVDPLMLLSGGADMKKKRGIFGGPVSSSGSSSSLPSWLGGMMSDFYYGLAVQIAEVCFASRNRNGGIMSVTEIQARLQQRQTRLGMVRNMPQEVSVNDICTAIAKLAPLGGGFRTIQVGSSSIMVVSVPTELDNDMMHILTIHQQLQEAYCTNEGVTTTQLKDATGWAETRLERSLDSLLQEGMAWVDTYQGVTSYWFPATWQEIQEKHKQQQAAALQEEE